MSDSLFEVRSPSAAPPSPVNPGVADEWTAVLKDWDTLTAQLRQATAPPNAENSARPHATTGRIDLDPEQVGDGLAKLVLTLLELIRQLLERQAIRRLDAGSLDHEQTERLGLTLMRLAQRMEELKTHFGLQGEDLNLDLGPLGKLL